jgi:3-oxoadipate enol-lactonase
VFADIDGNTLHYSSVGEGPPVVLVHGLGGSSNVWWGVTAALKQHHHVVSLDLRGHGRSAGKGEFTIERWAKDVGKLITHLELPAVTLVGHSLGSLVAQYLAWKQPELVANLVLVGAISHFTPDIGQRYRERADLVEREGVDAIIDEWLEGAVSPQTHATMPGGVGLLRDLVLSTDHKNYAKACRALAKAPTIERDDIGQPTLLVTGAYDRSTPLGMTGELHAQIPVTTVRVAPHVAHWLPVEDPAWLAAAMLEWLT